MGKLTDKLVGQGTAPALSPNPNGSGYTKQVEIISHNGSTIYFLDGDGNTQTGTAEENVLYLEGEIKYKYLRSAITKPGTNEIVVPAGWVRVENGPNSYKKDGGRGTPVQENTHPQKRPKIFHEPVAFKDDVTYKGKKLEDLVGGGSSGDGPKIYEIEDDLSSLPSATVAQLKVGDIVVVASSDGNTYSHIVSRKEEGVGELSDTKGIYFVSVGSVVEEYRFVYDEENSEWVYDSDYSKILENTKMYLHRLVFTDDIAEIVTDDPTPFTTDTLKTWLTNNGYTSKERALPFLNNQITKISATEANIYIGVNMTGSNLRKCYYRITLTAGTGIDTITFTQAQFNATMQNDIVIEL